MKDTGRNIWLAKLPLRSPSEDSWEMIEASMDNDLASERFQQQLSSLPLHHAPRYLWNRLEQQLTQRKIVRIRFIIASVAATLLLALLFRGLFIPEGKHTNIPREPATAKTEKIIPLEINIRNDLPKHSVQQNKISVLQSIQDIPSISSITENAIVAEVISTKREFTYISQLKMLPANSGIVVSSPQLPVIPATIITSSLIETDTLSAWLLARNTEKTVPPPLPKKAYQPKGFSLGIDYLNEPVSNPDQGTSVYHSFGLMAQYQVPTIEFRSGIGISYYAIPADLSAQYRSLSNSYFGHDTLINNGDTITMTGIVNDIGGINIYGREQSRFLNYSLGAGKRIYSRDRLSAIVQVGAGFSLLLSHSNNLQGNTYEALKSQANTYFNNIESNIPEINKSHFNLLTGLDFNYKLLKKLSISLEPTIKYYFDPIYKGRNSKAFSAGVRTGLLFKL
jgi:hypothetical protein